MKKKLASKQNCWIAQTAQIRGGGLALMNGQENQFRFNVSFVTQSREAFLTTTEKNTEPDTNTQKEIKL